MSRAERSFCRSLITFSRRLLLLSLVTSYSPTKGSTTVPNWFTGKSPDNSSSRITVRRTTSPGRMTSLGLTPIDSPPVCPTSDWPGKLRRSTMERAQSRGIRCLVTRVTSYQGPLRASS